MENETDVIRNQMTETRSSLTEKVERLQETVTATLENAASSVTDTVTSVTDAVQDTIHNVSDTVEHTVDSVKQTFDFRQQIQNHPWLLLGGAVGLGYLAGSLVGPRQRYRSTSWGRAEVAPPAYTPAASYASSPSTPASPPAAGKGSSWFDGLREAISPAVKQLQGLAVGAATGLLSEMVLKATPEALRSDLAKIADNLTTSLGGKPVHNLTGSTDGSGSF